MRVYPTPLPLILTDEENAERSATKHQKLCCFERSQIRLPHICSSWEHSAGGTLLGLEHSISNFLQLGTQRGECVNTLAQHGSALVHLIKTVHEVSPIG